MNKQTELSPGNIFHLRKYFRQHRGFSYVPTHIWEAVASPTTGEGAGTVVAATGWILPDLITGLRLKSVSGPGIRLTQSTRQSIEAKNLINSG
jgi:hypothetical protein